MTGKEHDEKIKQRGKAGERTDAYLETEKEC